MPPVLEQAILRARTRTSLMREKQRSSQRRQQQAQTLIRQQSEQKRVREETKNNGFKIAIGGLEKQIVRQLEVEASLRERGKSDAGIEAQGRNLRTQLRNLKQTQKTGGSVQAGIERGKSEAKAQASVVAQQRGIDEARSLPPVKRLSIKEKVKSILPKETISRSFIPSEPRRERGRDPVAVAFTETIPSLFIAVAKDLIPSSKARSDIKKFISKLQTKGDQTVQKLSETRTNIEEFFDPSQRDLRQIAERSINNLEREQTNLNREVTNFNQQFADKQLSEADFKEAEIQSLAISSIQQSIDDRSRRVDDKIKDLTARAEAIPTRFFSEVLKSIIVSPISLAELGISASTRPLQTTKQAIEEIKRLPSTISQAPASVTGGIAGTLIGTSIISRVLGDLTKVETLAGSNKNFIFERVIRGDFKRRVKPTQPFPTEIEFKINNNAVKSFTQKILQEKGINFNQLSKIEQNFLVGQVKSKILANPQLFIPKARRLALERLGIKNIKQAIQQRFASTPDAVVRFDKGGRVISERPLSETQRLALKRFQETLESKRLKEATKGRLERPLEKAFDLLSDSQKAFFISRIKARVKANPKLTLSKAQQTALENIQTQTQLKDIRTAILNGLEPKKVGDLLSLSQRRFIKSQIETQLRVNPAKFIGKEQQLALKRFQEIQEKKAIDNAIQKGSTNLKLSELISTQDKLFLKKKIDSELRNNPKRFIPETRGRALQLLERQKLVEKPKPLFKIVSGELSSQQLLVLNRLKQLGKPKPKKIIPNDRDETSHSTKAKNPRRIKTNVNPITKTKSKDKRIF